MANTTAKECEEGYYDPFNGNVKCFMAGEHEWHRGNVKHAALIHPNTRHVRIEWRKEDG